MRIKNFMTPCPYTIEGTATIDEALRMMELRSIRHLPVVKGNDLIGVVSERDIRTAKLVCETTKYCPAVSEICYREPLVFRDDTELAEVANKMAEQKEDCSLISDSQANFVGIFTTTDACKALYLLQDKRQA